MPNLKDAIVERLDEQELTVIHLAQFLGFPVAGACQLLLGELKLTDGDAKLLAEHLGETPEYWLSLEQ